MAKTSLFFSLILIKWLNTSYVTYIHMPETCWKHKDSQDSLVKVAKIWSSTITVKVDEVFRVLLLSIYWLILHLFYEYNPSMMIQWSILNIRFVGNSLYIKKNEAVSLKKVAERPITSQNLCSWDTNRF